METAYPQSEFVRWHPGLVGCLALAGLLVVGCGGGSEGPSEPPGEADGGAEEDSGRGADVPEPSDAGPDSAADMAEDSDAPGREDSGPEPDGGDSGGVGDSGPDAPPDPECDEGALSDLYTNYVEPFVSGQVPQSCSQCHMTGIDMSIYAQDTPCQTMACMEAMGAVNLADPDSSAILDQILMGDPNSSVFSVDSEHAAILEWIEWSAECHESVCGDVEDPCNAGTGMGTTGQLPTGDCSEEDLLVVFWDTVIEDRGRCVACHTDTGASERTFGLCTDNDQCEGFQECIEGLCRAPGPYYAPHFFEGGPGALSWDDPGDRSLGMNTMYNVLALGLLDAETPLNSTLMVKPLLEGFSPTAIYGPGVSIEQVPQGENAELIGTGVPHGGSSKFNFRCHEPPCPTEGVVDCRTERSCDRNRDCGDGESCQQGYCRIRRSVCDETYVEYVRLALYLQSCQGE